MWRFLKKLAAVPPKPHTPDEALTSFCTNRELLQNHFFRLAAASGKPRGLIWKSCHWLSTAAVAADGDDGLMLFCGVNVSFEAVAGGDMEDVAAVSAIRDGSAVFHHRNGRWGSGGRILFNLSPADAVEAATGKSPLLYTDKLCAN